MASWQSDAGPELCSVAEKESELDKNMGRECEVSERWD